MNAAAHNIRNSAVFKGLVKLNENLASHTTMHTGGPAALFIEPEDEKSLILAVNELKKDGIPFFVLGGGSNVIISDSGLEAVISTRKLSGIKKIETADGDKNLIIEISAGSSWGSVISFCRKNDLGGLEGFTGLSGTCGGALYMNATCFGLSACDTLISVRYLDLNDGKIHDYEKNPSDWAYKTSPFQMNRGRERRLAGKTLEESFERVSEQLCCEGKGAPAEGAADRTAAKRGPGSAGETYPAKIIISAEFTLRPGFDIKKSEECMNFRREKGHFKAPSAGSAFKNDAEHGIIAGKVIDGCGLKGLKCGGAQIAPWHGNFIINPEQKATAQDIKNLSDLVKKTVFEKKAVSLENEILFIGFQ